jgi:UDP-3-O-[3-hydroxymyristoyl] N-acetylglucosamine deacetylase
MAFQTTIRHKAVFSGTGLHSGAEVTVTLRPAEAGNGIVFHRVDLAPAVSIEAHAANVISTRLSTTIGNKASSVATIEHLMAALRGCGIDNVHVDINGPEVPIMDGSAADFVTGIRTAGRTTLARPRRYLVVRKPVTVTDGDKRVSIIPSRHFKVSFDIHFDHPAISSQSRLLTFSEEAFAADVSAARTFGFLAEVEMLKANGLARGGSLANAVVIGADGILNPEGLRYSDEFVRHKLLDSVGDLALCGYHLFGHVRASRSGHELNHRLVTALLARTDSWKLVEFTSRESTATALPLALPELAWLDA